MKSRGFCADRSRGDSFPVAEPATFRRVNVSIIIVRRDVPSTSLAFALAIDACEKHRLIAPWLQTARGLNSCERIKNGTVLGAFYVASARSRDVDVNTVNGLAVGSRRALSGRRNYLSVGSVFFQRLLRRLFTPDRFHFPFRVIVAASTSHRHRKRRKEQTIIA